MGDRMTFNNSPGVGFLGILWQSRRVSSLEKRGIQTVCQAGGKKEKGIPQWPYLCTEFPFVEINNFHGD